MAFNAIAYKKSMLAWDALAKKAPADIAQAAKSMAGDHPEVTAAVKVWSSQITTLNQKLRDLLDRVVNAKDDKQRTDAARNALSYVKQYQSYVSTTHLPPEVQTRLKNGLAELAKGLAT